MSEEGLKLLFYQYRDKIYGFFVQFLGDRELSNDLMQDIFLKLIQSNSELEEIADMDGYIYQMCRNRAYDHLKKAYRDKEYRDHLASHLDLWTNQIKPEAEKKMDADHYHEILEQSLSKLPDQQRLIFNLSKKEGLSHKKIAEKLNLSPITVRNHLHRAIKKIRATTNPDVDLIMVIVGWVIVWTLGS
ncbi:RNA polymerase sigma factor [Membranihabitans maritimus]|uniref:RNA polymerase sigma factor n=1 Tax=Membranihabitans maritimus TaxID=2904244 RepID=UPI001F028655|nr:RNA polymerase sigma-70 factor [Membranihabitans maritimus]